MIVVEISFISSTSSSQATLINVTEHEIARQPYKPNNPAKHMHTGRTFSASCFIIQQILKLQ